MLFPRKSSKWTAKEEAEAVEQIIATMEALWRPARMLTDLRLVWNDLSDAQRAEVENSKVYRAGFHEKRGEEMAKALGKRVAELPGSPYREVRSEVARFLRDWRNSEPDTLKILIGKIRAAHGVSAASGSRSDSSATDSESSYQS